MQSSARAAVIGHSGRPRHLPSAPRREVPGRPVSSSHRRRAKGPVVTETSPTVASEPSAGVRADDSAVVLGTTQLAKRFGSTEALRNCTFDLRKGEVHAILGENGSGKSTLVKVLAGVHRPDSGLIRLWGAEHQRMTSPEASIEAGIVTVFQEVLVVGQRTVLENVWLGADGLVRKHASDDEKRIRARDVLGELLGEVPNLDRPAGTLPLSVRQACCISRALVR